MKSITLDTLRQVLSETNGNRTETVNILRQAGYQISHSTVVRLIASSPELTAMFPPEINRTSGVETQAEAPNSNAVAVRDEPPAAQVGKQDEALKNGMLGAGFKEEEISKFESYSDFIMHGFTRTVDFTYGVMVKGVMHLEARAEYIQTKILDNDEKIEAVDKNGNPITIQRYSDDDKLAWNKEYLSIMQQIGKFADTTNNAALIRVKAHALQDDGGNDKRRKRMKKVKASGDGVRVAPKAA
jgi:hypothetical protein